MGRWRLEHRFNVCLARFQCPSGLVGKAHLHQCRTIRCTCGWVDAYRIQHPDHRLGIRLDDPVLHRNGCIALDRKAHRTAIRQAQEEQAAYDANGGTDTAYTRRLKRKGLKIPFAFIEWSPVIALAGLTVDTIVNWQRYPVIASWSRFWGGLLIGRPMGIDWGNLKAIAWNLTSLEILVVLLIICGQWIRAHKDA
jgi:hypothetical protein